MYDHGYGVWFLGDTVEYRTQDGIKQGKITDLHNNVAMVVDDDGPRNAEHEIHLSELTRIG